MKHFCGLAGKLSSPFFTEVEFECSFEGFGDFGFGSEGLGFQSLGLRVWGSASRAEDLRFWAPLTLTKAGFATLRVRRRLVSLRILSRLCYTYIYIYEPICDVCVYIYIYICVYVCMSTFIWYTRILYIYIHTYTSVFSI